MTNIINYLTKIEYVDTLPGHYSKVGYITYSLPMVIQIERNTSDGEAILAHEMQHAKDCLMTLWLAPAFQELFPRVKVWLEARAYKAQGWTKEKTLDVLSVYDIYKLPYRKKELSKILDKYFK